MQIELWQAVLGAITMGVGSFVASWMTMHKQLAVLTQRTASLEQAVRKDTRSRMDLLEARCAKIEERAGTAVHDEEFQAFTGQTTSTLNRLTEMVGRLGGALDAWGRSGR